MKKTLLLVFIHGFKGDDTTFSSFPTHLSALLSLALPHLSIQPLVYPSFETRGDLASTVRRFTDWLTTTVIDMEVAMKTPHPTVDPGVRVVLVGHSMGGLVAAECLLALAGVGGLIDGEDGASGVEREDVRKEADTVAGTKEKTEHTADDEKTQMFPYVQGLLAFDTPYLGISPGVVAHGAEGHWNATKAWYDSAASLFAASGLGAAAAEKAAKGAKDGTPNKKGDAVDPAKQQHNAQAATNTPGGATPQAGADAAHGGKTWTKYALYTLGASTLAAAAGTTAYLARNTLSSGLNWATSHLEFVGCLARPEELRSRVAKVVALSSSSSSSPSSSSTTTTAAATTGGAKIGFANFYTILGKGATSGDGLGGKRNEWSEGVLGAERTFCNVPKDVVSGASGGSRKKDEAKEKGKKAAGWWRAAKNDLAGDEVAAHCYMFWPDRNSGYYGMSEEVRGVVVEWIEEGGWGGGYGVDDGGKVGEEEREREAMEVD